MSHGGRGQAAMGGHEPVMAETVAQQLITDLRGVYLDATIGGGGHAEVILNRLQKEGRVVGFDRDPAAVSFAGQRLASFGSQLTVLRADYRTLADALKSEGINELSGALFDLGLSSLQLDDPQRGFAYRFDGPLDLRFDTAVGEPASVWLTNSSEAEIAKVLREYGEERHATRIARVIASACRSGSLDTTGQLLELLRKVTGPGGQALGRTAARVFQALRIVVNDELAAIPVGLHAVLDHLSDGGRVAVIAYHSLEDRIVKTLFREAARVCRCPKVFGRCVCDADPKGRMLNRRVIRASEDEVRGNPRAKAARLRVFERVTSLAGDAE